VRAIAVASVVLVAVTAGVTQSAREAPRPPGARRKTGEVRQIACASTKSCAALGEWLYTEQAGRWKATYTPSLPQAGSANLLSLACPAAGSCDAVGIAGEQHAVHASESGGQWQLGAVDLPSDAKPVDPPAGPSPVLRSVSCASAGDCLAAGVYFGSDRMNHPLLDAEASGTWGAGSEPQLPPNADTSPVPNQPGLGGHLTLVSCPAPGDCTAVGSYTNKDAGHSYYPWVTSESAGVWAPGAEALLPADAATLGDTEDGPSPFFDFTGLSCPSVGNCTAVGGYENKNGSEEGLILTERHGVWSRGASAPLPPKGIPDNEPNEFTIPMTSLSCATPDNCAAVGWYELKGSRKQQGWLLSERAGRWRASTLVLPAGAKAPAGMTLSSVACASRGNCVAVGQYYPAEGKARGMIVRELGGKWERAVNAALPKGAAPAGESHTFLNSASCPSAGACMVGGYYDDRSGHMQGLLLSLRLG
jgi:hypothetical protein